MAKSKSANLPGCDCPIKSGISALSKADKNKINLGGLKISGSLNVDACYKRAEPNANRWDYYISIEKGGELYLEIHRVNDDEIDKIVKKVDWLKEKININKWPMSTGRPFLLAPAGGIPHTPATIYGTLKKRLALHGVVIVRSGDSVNQFLD